MSAAKTPKPDAQKALETYRGKRKFDITAEPSGAEEIAPAGERLGFCVQKHDATRLHYDFRLELDGVLKSWAVTRGPSFDTHDKRLAVEVEDHPLAYGGFEGTIPKGQYGGGTVMLWDRGWWEPLEEPHEGLRKGAIKFALHGDKLTGKWTLIRMPPRPRDRHNNWLLIKEKDDIARPGGPCPARQRRRKRAEPAHHGPNRVRTRAGSGIRPPTVKVQRRQRRPPGRRVTQAP